KKWTPLHCAAAKGNTGIVEILLKAKANVNAEDEENWSPLHFAANTGHKKIVEILVRAGAHINATCKLGNTPVFYSNANGYHEVSKYLLECGATLKQGALQLLIEKLRSVLTTRRLSHIKTPKIVHMKRHSSDVISPYSEHNDAMILTTSEREVTPSGAYTK
ncbi:unnamed protein product, partial [Candidula unifasciata]